MVYQGPSRACLSCKTRRKKCDETRPACLRCLKANRTCHGYDHNALTPFRNFSSSNSKSSTSAGTLARRCGLPKRAVNPHTNEFTPNDIPTEIPQETSDWYAFRAFLYDFCIESSNRSLSRGYLSGLEVLAVCAGPESDLVRICEAVSFASHAKPLNRPHLEDKAESFYQNVVTSLSRRLVRQPDRKSKEFQFIIFLLGLYEMIAESASRTSQYITHVKGLSAFLKIGQSPLNLVKMQRGSSTGYGMFSIPAMNERGKGLDDLLVALDELWENTRSIIQSDEIAVRRAECAHMQEQFSDWQELRSLESRPTQVATVATSDPESPRRVGYYPGKIDTYFDLSVAGAWNTFRTARLLLIALSLTFSESSNNEIALIALADRIARDLAASIPYHLTDNLQTFCKHLGENQQITDRGRTLGGLLLIHPLYLASQMPFLNKEMRDYFRRCLAWIGEEMGIGYAAMLSKSTDCDLERLKGGCMVIWAGFLG